MFATCIGDIRIPAHGIQDIDNEQAAKEILKHDDLVVDWISGDGRSGKKYKEPEVNYERYRIWELRSIAAGLGIKGFFTMRKLDLIKKITEADNAK